MASRGPTAREYLTALASTGDITRVVTLATRTRAELFSPKARSPERRALGEEAAAMFPEGIEKQTVGRYQIGFDYEAAVNAQRLKEGKSADFKIGQLWKGKGLADPNLPAYMALHAAGQGPSSASGQYLYTRPTAGPGGQVFKDQTRYVNRATGEEVPSDVAERYMPGQGRSRKQGLEEQVGVRMFALENIAGIQAEDEAGMTAIGGAGARPPGTTATAGGGEEGPEYYDPFSGNGAGGGEGGEGGAGGGGPDLFDVFKNQGAPGGTDWGQATQLENADRAYQKLLGAAAAKGAEAIFGKIPGMDLLGKAVSGQKINGADILGTAGAALGGAVGGKPGSAIGQMLGRALGGAVGGNGSAAAGINQPDAGGGGGGGARRTGSGGNYGDDLVSILSQILTVLRSIESNGVKIINLPRGNKL